MGITPNLECTRLNDVQMVLNWSHRIALGYNVHRDSSQCYTQGHNSYRIDEFCTILLLEVALADA